VWESLFDGSGNRGPLLNWDDDFEVTERGAGANMSVDVQTGAAIIDGEWAISDSIVNLTVAANASGMTRYDLVFLHWTAAAQTTSVRIVDGTPGAGSCESIANYQNAGVEWAVPLACVEVVNGAATIQDADITDEREFCRYRTDPADIIDGSTLDQNAANQIRIAPSGVGIVEIAAAIAGDGLVGGGGAALDVNVDGVTLEIVADTLQIINGEVDESISANRTRTWYVGANELHEPAGGLYALSPTWGNIDIQTDATECWIFDPGQDMGVIGHTQVPADAVAGAVTISAIWTHAEPGWPVWVRWYLEYVTNFGCIELLTPTNMIVALGPVGAAAENYRICTAFSNTVTLAAGEFFDFIVGRNGSHPADDCSSDAGLLGVLFSYTADM